MQTKGFTLGATDISLSSNKICAFFFDPDAFYEDG
jgi:hypothetical protein